eukprot:UN02659
MREQDEDMDEKYSSTTIGGQIDDEVVIGQQQQQQQQQRSTYAQQQQNQPTQQQQQQQKSSRRCCTLERRTTSTVGTNHLLLEICNILHKVAVQQQQEVQIQSSYYGSTNGQLYREIPQDDGNNPKCC